MATAVFVPTFLAVVVMVFKALERTGLVRGAASGVHGFSKKRGLPPKQRLRRQLARLGSRASTADLSEPNVEARLRDTLTDWRGLFERQVPQARQILRDLLKGTLMFRPKDGYYEFWAEGTLAKVLASLYQPMTVASPAGVEPAF